MDRPDFEVLAPLDVAKLFGIDERTLRRWITEGYFPRQTSFGKRKGWRPAQIQKWMDATEYLQGLGLSVLVPPEEEEPAK